MLDLELLTDSSNPLLDTASNVSNEQQQERSLSDLRLTNDRLWCMRWFVLIIVALGFLGSIAASIVLIIVAKTLLTLIVPPSLALIMRPIVLWLFPLEQHNKTLIGKSSILPTLLDAIGTYVGAKEVAKNVARGKKEDNLPELEG
jgi:hypothetical protein